MPKTNIPLTPFPRVAGAPYLEMFITVISDSRLDLDTGSQPHNQTSTKTVFFGVAKPNFLN
jgi:hypothetical protein